MVSQASKLLDDAREQAVADARRKAEIYAKAAGVALGAPISISEGGAAQPLFRARMAVPMAAAPMPIAQGEETLSITVGMTWAIKPKAVTSPRLPGEVGLRSNPGEGDSPRTHSSSNLRKAAPHPNPLPARAGRGRRTKSPPPARA